MRSIFNLGDALVILSSSAANAATGSFYFSGFILFSGFLLERVWTERSNCKRKTNELRVEQKSQKIVGISIAMFYVALLSHILTF